MRCVLPLAAGVCLTLGLALADEPPTIADATPRTEAAMVEFLPRPSAAEEKIIKALDQTTDVDFTEETLLHEVAAYLGEKHAINIVVDTAALKATNVQPTISVKLKEIRLKSFFNLYCQSNQMAWIVEDDVLKLTSPTVAESLLLTRAYPVGDLCPTPDDSKALKTALEKTVDASSWESVGGPGSIAAVDSAKSLVISQTWRGHTRVLDLLRTLREARRLAPRRTP